MLGQLRSGALKLFAQTDWQKRYGDEAWSLLESTAGKLG
jgi:hypothetical protein